MATKQDQRECAPVILRRSLTTRQQQVLRYWYRDGWSYRRIAGALSCGASTAYREHRIALEVIERAVINGDLWNSAPYIGGLFLRSATSHSTRECADAALRRQEQLVAALESWMDDRSAELDEIAECMDGSEAVLPHPKKNGWDRWELTWMARHKLSRMRTPDYEARRLMEFLPGDSDAQA